MGVIGDVLGFGANLITSGKNKKEAKKNREQQLDFASNLNWDPAYASDAAPTYKRSESPIARSYLESILMGNNPDMTFSGAPNAEFTKAAQQQSQNQMFGTPQERAARARQILEEQPWAVQSPAELAGQGAGMQPGGAGSLNNSQDVFSARYPLLGDAGWTQGDLDRFRDVTGEPKILGMSGMSAGGDAPLGGKYDTDAFIKLKEAMDRGASKKELAKLYSEAIGPGIKWK